MITIRTSDELAAAAALLIGEALAALEAHVERDPFTGVLAGDGASHVRAAHDHLLHAFRALEQVELVAADRAAHNH